MGFVFLEPITKAKKISAKRMAREHRKLIDKFTPAVQVSFLKGIRVFRDKVKYDELLKSVKAGKVKNIDKIAPWTKLADDMKNMEVVAQSAVVAGGETSMKYVPAVISAEMRFDPVNPRIAKWIKKNTGKRITAVVKETKDAVKDMVSSSFMKGQPPAQVARTIRDSIGVNRVQAGALVKYQEKLVEDGITGRKLERLTKTRRKELEIHRAKIIARTEMANAVNAGHLELWKQAADEKLVDLKKSKKIWITSPQEDEDECTPMDGVEVPIDQPWSTELGSVMTPSEIHPNCNCTFEVVPEIL